MKTHLTVVGLINLGTGLFFTALAALTVIGILVLAPAFYGGSPWKPDDGIFVATTVVLVSGVFLLIGIPSLIAGIGMLMQKSWARFLAIITAILMVTIPPLGTIAGIYSLWVLVLKETPRPAA